jgi:hypothetical protein
MTQKELDDKVRNFVLSIIDEAPVSVDAFEIGRAFGEALLNATSSPLIPDGFVEGLEAAGEQYNG